jgi:hypothetical protein
MENVKRVLNVQFFKKVVISDNNKADKREHEAENGPPMPDIPWFLGVHYPTV